MDENDKIQENVRHENKCLQFKTSEGVNASEVLEKYPEAASSDNLEGPLLSKWSGREDEILFEGFPFTSFSWTSQGNLKVWDDSGKVVIDGGLVSHACAMHGMS